MSYAECLKKYYNAVDGTFYDAINFSSLQTLVAILQAKPKNSDPRYAGQAWPVENSDRGERTRFFRAK